MAVGNNEGDHVQGKGSWCHFPAKEAQVGTTITCRQYFVGDIPVGITLNFLPGDTLAGYSMGFGSESYSKIRGTTIEKFGPPISTQTLQYRMRNGVVVPGEETRMAAAEWDHCHAHTPGDTDLPTPESIPVNPRGRRGGDAGPASSRAAGDGLADPAPADRGAAHRDGHLDGARLVRAGPRRDRRCTRYGAPGVTRLPDTGISFAP